MINGDFFKFEVLFIEEKKGPGQSVACPGPKYKER